MHRPSRSKKSGFSLVEAVLAISLFGMVLGTIGFVAISGSQAYRSSTVDASLVQQGRRSLREVVELLKTSRAASLEVYPEGPLWQDTIEFDRYASMAPDGTVTWETVQIRFAYEENELDDGIDNNGNGLVDEGVLEVVTDWGGPNERTRVLTHWVREYLEGEDDDGEDENGNELVDENGFCFERVGDAWVVRLTLERRTTDGVVARETLEARVRPRN